jgi:hypothetical protein
MTYKLQTNWGGAIVGCKDKWEDSCAWRVFGNLERGIKALRHDADLSRVCCPLRLVDLDGKVYATYEPEDDMRLPGCRWRATERGAKALWEAAGKPEGRDEEFWLKAESELPDSIGVTVLES